MGRPSTFTQSKADAICDRLMDGESLRKICRDPKMPAAITVLKWLRDNDEFAAQYAHARDAQADTLADEIVEIAEGAKKGDDVNRDRLRVDARKWVAAKLKPKKYGDKIDVTSGDQPLKELDETAMAARVASLIKVGLERDGAR